MARSAMRGAAGLVLVVAVVAMLAGHVTAARRHHRALLTGETPPPPPPAECPTPVLVGTPICYGPASTLDQNGGTCQASGWSGKCDAFNPAGMKFCYNQQVDEISVLVKDKTCDVSPPALTTGAQCPYTAPTIQDPCSGSGAGNAGCVVVFKAVASSLTMTGTSACKPTGVSGWSSDAANQWPACVTAVLDSTRKCVTITQNCKGGETISHASVGKPVFKCCTCSFEWPSTPDQAVCRSTSPTTVPSTLTATEVGCKKGAVTAGLTSIKTPAGTTLTTSAAISAYLAAALPCGVTEVTYTAACTDYTGSKTDTRTVKYTVTGGAVTKWCEDDACAKEHAAPSGQVCPGTYTPPTKLYAKRECDTTPVETSYSGVTASSTVDPDGCPAQEYSYTATVSTPCALSETKPFSFEESDTGFSVEAGDTICDLKYKTCKDTGYTTIPGKSPVLTGTCQVQLSYDQVKDACGKDRDVVGSTNTKVFDLCTAK